MRLACHKKSCLIWVEFSNFRNITKYFFFNWQNWDSQQGRDSCLKMNKYVSKNPHISNNFSYDMTESKVIQFFSRETIVWDESQLFPYVPSVLQGRILIKSTTFINDEKWVLIFSLSLIKISDKNERSYQTTKLHSQHTGIRIWKPACVQIARDRCVIAGST